MRPQLEQMDFHVPPTVRVGHPLPVSLAATSAPNRYLMSTLMSLDESQPPDRQLGAAALAQLDLDGYLSHVEQAGNEHREQHEPGSTDRRQDVLDLCLVFDQFEELFTLDPTDQAAKDEYLKGLGIALRNRTRWALFAMREDFIAQLDPYLAYFPTRLSARYRIDLLGVDAARLAVRAPAAGRGVEFADDAAERLVDDLRQVRVQRAGQVADEQGPYVEPVQLQVVCHQLWNTLSSGPAAPPERISLHDVTALGDVDEALATFYDATVAAAAEATGTREREIRAWFESQLVTEQGFRNQVLDGPSEQGPAVLRELENAHMIRADSRQGINWYEICHDRLVSPIRASNAAWREANLSTLQREAPAWNQQGRPRGLLVTGALLREVEAWAADHPDELLPVDRAYLTASQEEDQRLAGERRSARRTRRLAVLSTTVGIVAAISLVLALLATQATKRSQLRQRDLEVDNLQQQAEADVARAESAELQARSANAQAEAARAAIVDLIVRSNGMFSGMRLDGQDLAGADLRRLSMPWVSLRGADLRGANLTGANLVGANLSGADLSGSQLIGADLSYAVLTGADLSGATLSLSRLDAAAIEGVITWVDATCPDGSIVADAAGTCAGRISLAGSTHGGELVGLDLSTFDLRDVTFEDADLRLTRLPPDDSISWISSICPDGQRSADLEGGSCVDAHLGFTGGSYAGLDLTHIRLVDTDVSGADFTGADLTGATIASSLLARADLSGANLGAARLEQLGAPELDDAVFLPSSLTGASLADTDLRGVSFGAADTADLIIGQQVCVDAASGIETSREAECDWAEIRSLVEVALFGRTETLDALDEPENFEYTRQFWEPGSLFAGGLEAFVEPPARNVHITFLDDEHAFAEFALLLKPTVADALGLGISASQALSFVKTGDEWKITGASMCDVLGWLEYNYELIAPAPPVPLDQCREAYPIGAFTPSPVGSLPVDG